MMSARKRSAEEAFARTNKSTLKSKVVHFPESTSNGRYPQDSHHQANYHSSNGKTNLKQRAKDLLSTRQQLPIWSHAEEIRAKLRSHDVLLMVGETGSGKSTQVPQFLVNEPWCQRLKLSDGSHVGGCIAITQPRRVAAISLARRVAEEMGTPLGGSSPASLVGYSVRFDNSSGPATKVKFLTEGMLLQEMLRDPWLKEYSAVVVDEVHERGVNVDLVLGFLRQMQEKRREGDDGRRGMGLKVVVMSATADMEKVRDFFNFKQVEDQPSTGHQNGATNGNSKGSEDEEWSGFSEDEKKGHPVVNGDHAGQSSPVTTQYIKGRQYPVEIHYTPSPIADILDAALQRIIHIHAHSPLPGDVLVFLTGQETVETLLSLVEAYSLSIRKDPKLSKTLPQLLILPLYAALPSHLQQRVFQATPKFTRKIILATNIAETSITVPGIWHVIDSGKSKRRLFRPSLNLDSLLTTSISRSSAKQRSGRAGRDAPGHAYRLYTEADFYKLAADTEPEILRCDLSQLVLSLKSHGIDNVASFPLLTPPPRRALERALIHLLQLSALSPSSGQITLLGRSMSRLPLPASLARILLASAEPRYDCIDEIVDIVSALSVENLFLNIHHHHNQNSSDSDNEDGSPSDSRLQLRAHLTRREGDHLTLLATVQAYVSENADRKRWCDEHGVSHRAMQAVLDVRKQLAGLMTKQKRNINNEDENGIKSSAQGGGEADLSTRILKCLLTGLHPNVARLSSSPSSTSKSPATTTAGGGYTTLHTNQAVHIHPSSVLFGRKVEAIVYSEFVFTNRTYARGVSAVELGWVADVVRELGQEHGMER